MSTETNDGAKAMNEDHHPVGRPSGERGAMAIDRAELRKRAEAATKGEWRDGFGLPPTIVNDLADADGDREVICIFPQAAGYVGDQAKANFAYIVAAQPQVVLALLDCIEELEGAVRRANHHATNQSYMLAAYWQMLGPKGLEVANMWREKGVTRVHHSWGPDAAAMSGEERAQVILDVEAAPKTLVTDIDGELAARKALSGEKP